MSKRKRAQPKQERKVPVLFSASPGRRRRSLFLPKYLADEADKPIHRNGRQEQAYAIMQKWVQLESQGHIFKKETAVDADFLIDVFGTALGHRPFSESPDRYELLRNFTVPGVGTADGALGNFTPQSSTLPLVVIELKDAETNLDRDKFNGRTPVQQCWDYLNALPNCPWGIVSNFVTFRLYHRDKTPQAYEEFKLQELRDIKRFREFYCIFEAGGLVRSVLGQPTRGMLLLERTENRQREVGDLLYDQYRENRVQLIQHLRYEQNRPLETAIRIAQKILDRIIFVAFCEDRGLLPEKCIEATYKTIPPFSKVTNPRWRNFLELFQAIDKGHDRFDLKTGYDGGLFEHDDDVDNLQLDDRFTHFFNAVGGYDFRDEVNVEVLGHIFEKSITELEKMRTVGLFGTESPKGTGSKIEPAMTKSAMRKRFGIFYTPVDFTQFIVLQTLSALIDERFESLRHEHGLKPEQLEAEEPTDATAKYWRDCLDVLRQIKVCDSACGSGAFLIQAYDVFEERYQKVVERIIAHEGYQTESLEDKIPDMILADNLFGVDLSREAVEITQLALWIRSARRGKTLADLSHNIVCGNSLVTDPAVDERAMNWESTFPGVFAPEERGFDCVIGNPPWERLKLQEREFFAFTAPEIAGAVSAARRRELIAELERANPELYASYIKAKDAADRTLAHVRNSGNFPLTGKGDINTYAVFAELARKIVAPHGRVGLLVPSGIATDNTTKEFFGELTESQALISLYDFENKAPIFPDVHRSYKFCVLVLGGSLVKTPVADFTFFGHQMTDINDKNRHISLTSEDLKLLNPNTRTCPVFRSRRDAELTKAIYRRVPILIDEARRKGGNPWGIKFVTIFHQTNDAELFHPPEQLHKMGFKLQDNRWTKGKRSFLPLYEAKMFRPYDHRFGTVYIDTSNWINQGQTEETTLVQHQNPEFVVQPRWWTAEEEVTKSVQGATPAAFLAFRDVTRTTDTRTTLASFIPFCGVTNTAPLILFGESISPRQQCCLLANLNSFVLDFVARQKIGGIHLNYFILEQLPVLPPDRYADRCPWDKRQTLERWISDRVLKLTCTADDMRPLAEAAKFDPTVHKWNPTERAELMAELDAAFFLLYGVRRTDAEYVLSTFQGTSETDESTGTLFRTDVSILEALDRLSTQMTPRT